MFERNVPLLLLQEKRIQVRGLIRKFLPKRFVDQLRYRKPRLGCPQSQRLVNLRLEVHGRPGGIPFGRGGVLTF